MPTKKSLKKSGKTTKKPLKKSTAKSNVNQGSRVRKLTRRQNKKRDAEKYKKEQKLKQLPAAWILLAQSLKHLYRYKKTFLGILLVYAIFYVLFIKGISANFQLGNLRNNLETTLNGKLSKLNSGFALFGLLLGTAGTTSSESAGVYQTVLLVLTSLALIWALRATFGGRSVGIKDSFYKSTGTLVPFIAVCFLLIVQFLPALIVSSLYNSVRVNGLLVGPFQSVIAFLILGAGLGWTLYMLSSTLFALYIVTLSDAKPRASVQAAKQLVRFRRGAIIRKVLFLPVVLLLFSVVVLIPLIIFIPIAAEIIFLVFTILVLGVFHSYFYTLYRSLLNE